MGKVIQVRDVPDDVHDALVREAKAAGLSLNQFMLREYEKIARRARNTEIFTRAAQRKGRRLTREQIVETIRELREQGE